MAVITYRYKLVLSVGDKPWLIEMEKDPNEEINFYKNPKYKKIVIKLQAELLKRVQKYNDPAFSKGKKEFNFQ